MLIVKRRGKWTEPWGRPSMKVIVGPMEPFTRTLAVRFMNLEDIHPVKRRGTTIFDIFMMSTERQTRSYAQLMSKNVVIVRRRWAD